MLLQSLGIVAYWTLGAGFSSNGQEFIGYKNFLFLNGHQRQDFFKVRKMHLVQSITHWCYFKALGGVICVTIASAGGQEFVNWQVDALLAFLVPAFIYAVPLHWLQNKDGWLVFTETLNGEYPRPIVKTRDMAGAGFVHLVLFQNLMTISCVFYRDFSRLVGHWPLV